MKTNARAISINEVRIRLEKSRLSPCASRCIRQIHTASAHGIVRATRAIIALTIFSALQCLAQYELAVRWTDTLKHSASYLTADTQGRLFAAGNGGISALDLDTGKLYWTIDSYKIIQGRNLTIAGENNIVYLFSNDRKAHALSAISGNEVWAFNLTNSETAQGALSINSTLLIIDGSYLYAVDSQTGKVKWRTISPTGEPFLQVSVGINGIAFCGSLRQLFAIDSISGRILWTSDFGAQVSFAPAIASDGTIYVTDSGGSLTAINGLTGTRSWTAGGAFFPVIDNNGMIYSIGYGGIHRVRKNGMRDNMLNLESARDIAIGDNGMLYVLEGGFTTRGWEHTISVYRYRVGSDSVLLWSTGPLASSFSVSPFLITKGGSLLLGESSGKITSYKTPSKGPGTEWPVRRGDFRGSCLSTIARPPVVFQQAKAVAVVVNGFVVGFSILDPGSGYSTPPTVSFSGNGIGASATALIKDGRVVEIKAGNAGFGYSGEVSVNIEAPQSTGPTSPRLSISVGSFSLSCQVPLGFWYQIEESIDGLQWIPHGFPFLATTPTLEFEIPNEGVTKLFRIVKIE